MKAYSFGELSESAKQKVRYYYQENDTYFKSDFILENMLEGLEDFDLDDNGIHYSLSYVQGDYVGITGCIKDDKLHELIMGDLDVRNKKKYKFWVIDRSYIEVTQYINYHHYYGQQCDIGLEIRDFDDTGLINIFARNLEDIVENVINKYIRDLLSKMQFEAYEQIEYLDSDEFIEEYYDSVKFDEEGNFILEVTN